MSLSLYGLQQEENVYIRRQADVWQRSGLISPKQHAAVLEHTNSGLRQTHLFFRILFFGFTAVFTGALVGLMCWLLDGKDEVLRAGCVFLLGLAGLALAQYLIKKRNLYRHGLEEALFMAGIILPVIGFLMWANASGLSPRAQAVTACIFLAALSSWVYLRAGYLYVMLIGIASLCVLPFQFSLSVVGERLAVLCLLSFIFLCTFFTGRPLYDFQKGKKTTLQTCLLGAIYLGVNLEIGGLIDRLVSGAGIGYFNLKVFPVWMYWTSYFLTFMIPVACLVWGMQSRKRLLLNVSLIMACVTLATNKSYLGWTRYAWDPAILGAFLIAVSLLVNRWLRTGPQGERFGFTAADMLKPESSGIDLGDLAAAVMPGVIEDSSPSRQDGGQFFENGSSGGGGAERSYE